jgi:hypothetical protein
VDLAVLTISMAVIFALASMWALTRWACVRWWDWLIVAALGGLFLKPVVRNLTGDMSRCLPAFLWSEGSDGKDEIVLVSAVCTVLFAVWPAALIVGFGTSIVRSVSGLFRS